MNCHVPHWHMPLKSVCICSSPLIFFSLSKSRVPQTRFLYVHEELVQRHCELAPSPLPANHTLKSLKKYSREREIKPLQMHHLLKLMPLECSGVVLKSKKYATELPWYDNPQNTVDCSSYQCAPFSKFCQNPATTNPANSQTLTKSDYSYDLLALPCFIIFHIMQAIHSKKSSAYT